MSANNEESATTPQIPTKLIHLTYDGNFQLECEANVLECRWMTKEKEVEEKEEKKEDEMKVELQLDITTMHPQGKIHGYCVLCCTNVFHFFLLSMVNIALITYV